MKLERVYTVPLGKASDVARQKRVPRAVKILRQFISRHMKQEDERITISAMLNEYFWARSIKKPPRRVKVRLIKDAGFIRAYLADEKVTEPKKKTEEKKEEPKKAEAKKEEPKPAHAPAAPKPAAAGKAPSAPAPKTAAPKPAAPAHTGEKK
ncbi:MAG: 50S ribosomal protein L31e [Candidatus ainarchaeum sp.]|nr:50S ribosomal protein L31e [Candidatus ainarchaeum sp.]